MRFGTTLPTPKPPLITEVPYIPIAQMLANVTSSAQNQPTVEPPLPQKLIPIVPTQIEDQSFDIIDQLKNMHIQIPLFQAIKESLSMVKPLMKLV